MGQVFLDITMSLDGFVTGPNVGVANPLGEGGKRLHDWLFLGAADPDGVDRRVAEELFAGTGAFVMGRRMFDVGIGEWGDDGAFGVPVFVLTHRAGEAVAKGPTTFHFATGGIGTAIAAAKGAAGDQNVGLVGGAEADRQALAAGLVDELRVHVATFLLGAGTRLFEGGGWGHVELERTRVVESPFATHLRYRVVR
jgi:dihydrofolate reductase